jgi:hypothetical protein
MKKSHRFIHLHAITTTNVAADFGELAEILGDQQCHYTCVEAINHFRLHPTSILCIDKVFEHLLMLWIGIMMPPHTITTTTVVSNFGELAKILL